MDQDTTFTVIAQSTDPATHEGWPYPNKYTTSLVGGTLADRAFTRYFLTYAKRKQERLGWEVA